jgi:hypothetical protein
MFAVSLSSRATTNRREKFYGEALLKIVASLTDKI